MNKLVVEGSGFPATNQTWRFLRDMINDVHQLTKLGGTSYILEGVVLQNNAVSDGFLVLDGELIPFVGGALPDGGDPQIMIVEAIETTTYLEDLNADGVGDEKDTYFTRHATFGTAGAVTYSYKELERLEPLTEIQRRLPPKKCALPYWGDGTDLKAGWQFCDGTNGTPDLRGQFIVGQDPTNPDYQNIGDQGGAEEVTLTTAQMPQHNHTGNVVIPPHTHSLGGKTAITYNGEGGDGNRLTDNDNIGNGTITQTSPSAQQNAALTTNNRGSSQAHENRPPYYTMAYITDLGV